MYTAAAAAYMIQHAWHNVKGADFKIKSLRLHMIGYRRLWPRRQHLRVPRSEQNVAALGAYRLPANAGSTYSCG